MLPETKRSIEDSRDQTIQGQVRQGSSADGTDTGGIFTARWMAKAGMFIPAWWSEERDKELRNFWKKTDHLSGAIYTMTAKMTAIPFKIIPKESKNYQQRIQASQLTEILRDSAQFGEGWPVFFGRFVEDLLTQDNGAFAEIIGPGSPDGPITGRPTGIAHLDSAKCQRTGDPEFPVLYMDTDGKRYRLHYTRVMFSSQMTSPIAEMHGVGFCAVSRCINVSQNLLDILTFKQEKLGSRPHRGVIITQGGLSPKDMAEAFSQAAYDNDSAQLSRYARIVVVGDSTLEEADAKLIDLAELPEGFDEQTSVTLGMATIALALGMDARELFPGMTAGATRADALLQHLKQRGKGPGQILEITERLLNHKFLPYDFKIVFDFQDDQEDRQIAEIKRIRAEYRNLEIGGKTINVRIARENMLENGDIDLAQFELLEAQDGRLPDGQDIVNLVYSKDPFVRKYLKFSVSDPLDVIENTGASVGIETDMPVNNNNGSKEIDTNETISVVSSAGKVADILKDVYSNENRLRVDMINNAQDKSFDLGTATKIFYCLQKVKELYMPQHDGLVQPPEAGRRLTTMGPTDPGMEEIVNPRDLTKPRRDDINAVAQTKDAENAEVSLTADPFGQAILGYPELIAKSLSSYRAGLRQAARGYWNGTFNFVSFLDAFYSTLNVGLTNAWYQGAEEEGIQPGELTMQERARLSEEINNEAIHVSALADFIETNSKENGGKLGSVYDRVELWVNAYTRVKGIAQLMAAQDTKKMWTLHPAEHCESCKKLDGKVKRASYWAAHDVYPKSWDMLDCKLGCKCTLEDTDLPVSPGPLPNLP